MIIFYFLNHFLKKCAIQDTYTMQLLIIFLYRFISSVWNKLQNDF